MTGAAAASNGAGRCRAFPINGDRAVMEERPMVNGDARIWASCTYDLPSGTAVRCSVEKHDDTGYGVSLVFGDGTGQGEIVLEMPETLLGVLVAQVKQTVLEIREARLEMGVEVLECLPGV